MLFSNYTVEKILKKILSIDEGDADSISMQEKPDFEKTRPAIRELTDPRMIFL